jgi:hypothetical protein
VQVTAASNSLAFKSCGGANPSMRRLSFTWRMFQFIGAVLDRALLIFPAFSIFTIIISDDIMISSCKSVAYLFIFALVVGSSTVIASPSKLAGVFSQSTSTGGLTCNLALIDATSGANQTFPLSFCDSIGSTYPSFSSLYGDSQLLVVIARDSAVHSIDISTGTERDFAPLPTYNSTDPFLGLITIGGKNVYLVTRFSLFSVSEGSVVQV